MRLDAQGNRLVDTDAFEVTFSLNGTTISVPYQVGFGQLPGEPEGIAIYFTVDENFGAGVLTIAFRYGNLPVETISFTVVDEPQVATSLRIGAGRHVGPGEYDLVWADMDNWNAAPGQTWRIFARIYDQFGNHLGFDYGFGEFQPLVGGIAGDAVEVTPNFFDHLTLGRTNTARTITLTAVARTDPTVSNSVTVRVVPTPGGGSLPPPTPTPTPEPEAEADAEVRKKLKWATQK